METQLSRKSRFYKTTIQRARSDVKTVPRVNKTIQQLKLAFEWAMQTV